MAKISANSVIGAQLERAVGETTLIELVAGTIEQVQGLADFADVSEHRNQQIDPSERGGAQYRAQLGQEHVRVRQTPADRPQSERRIQMRLVLG